MEKKGAIIFFLSMTLILAIFQDIALAEQTNVGLQLTFIDGKIEEKSKTDNLITWEKAKRLSNFNTITNKRTGASIRIGKDVPINSLAITGKKMDILVIGFKEKGKDGKNELVIPFSKGTNLALESFGKGSIMIKLDTSVLDDIDQIDYGDKRKPNQFFVADLLRENKNNIGENDQLILVTNPNSLSNNLFFINKISEYPGKDALLNVANNIVTDDNTAIVKIIKSNRYNEITLFQVLPKPGIKVTQNSFILRKDETLQGGLIELVDDREETLKNELAKVKNGEKSLELENKVVEVALIRKPPMIKPPSTHTVNNRLRERIKYQNLYFEENEAPIEFSYSTTIKGREYQVYGTGDEARIVMENGKDYAFIYTGEDKKWHYLYKNERENRPVYEELLDDEISQAEKNILDEAKVFNVPDIDGYVLGEKDLDASRSGFKFEIKDPRNDEIIGYYIGGMMQGAYVMIGNKKIELGTE